MTNESNEVRLFPSAHISSDREAELRATSALLSMLCAVNEFGRVVLRACGAPAGTIKCYSEKNYVLEGANSKGAADFRPDGSILVFRGKRRWRAFVEVKVGDAGLDRSQVDVYHRLAKQEGYDAVITVSSQAASADGSPPVALDGRRLRSTPVTHFSWERLLSEAQVLSRKKAVSDPDQEWMLNEWVRYIDDPKSRIVSPPDLGPEWSNVVKAAQVGALTAKSPSIQAVADKWRAYLSKLALRLRAKLGADVTVRVPKAERDDCGLQVARIVEEAIGSSSFSGAFKIRGAAGDVQISIYPASKSARFQVDFAAPTEGRQQTRLNWLARQLRGLEKLSGAMLGVMWTARGLQTQCELSEFGPKPESVLRGPDGNLISKDTMPRRFTISRTVKLTKGRGRSSAPILEALSQQLEDFYHQIVEHITPYAPSVPKLKPSKDPQTAQAVSGDERESAKPGESNNSGEKRVK